MITLDVQEDGKVYIEHAFTLHGNHEQVIYNVHAQVIVMAGLKWRTTKGSAF
ncbi:hypothetical protein [Geomicrobium sp. JCM 19038]|uniref:hypothetical protein n=1 Tax=Geomicrobium sp. JCM 19038 TaxID=1460635 RepID=UPI00045F2279|nr:hypothetical protein [Geomicrobium sp. JCM 19038]GAK10086.1 hypothetical protein JCM19038_3968 [Geomicrobium sp. JCM 19038]